jgi:hypothetical protein
VLFSLQAKFTDSRKQEVKTLFGRSENIVIATLLPNNNLPYALLFAVAYTIFFDDPSTV